MKSNDPQPSLAYRIARKLSRIKYQWIYNPKGRTRRRDGGLEDLSLYSAYVDNINPEVLKMQEAVFEHLGLKLQQVTYSSGSASYLERHQGHGQKIQSLIEQAPTENMIFFDIDCIPLSRSIIEHLYKPVIESGALIGPIQVANHMLDRRPYAAPSALGISKSLYRRLGRPHLLPDHNVDVAAILTRKCDLERIPVVLLPITHCVEPKDALWEVGKPEYGLGTTYAEGIYHNFGISKKEGEKLFIEKCRSVIGDSYK